MAREKRNTTPYNRVVVSFYHVETGKVYFEDPVAVKESVSITPSTPAVESTVYYTPEGINWDSPTLAVYTFPQAYFRVSEFLLAKTFDPQANESRAITLSVVKFGDRFITTYPHSYIFIAFTDSADDDFKWSVITSLLSLNNFVRYPLPYKDDPQFVPYGEVVSFLHRCALQEARKGHVFTEGDLVVVSSLGVTGVIKERKNRETFVVQVNMFKSTINMEVSGEDLHPF